MLYFWEVHFKNYMVQIQKSSISILLFFLLILSIGCLDELDTQFDNTLVNNLVIQGRIVKGNPSVATVQITNVFTFQPERLISAQSVVIFDEEGDRVELQQFATGFYREFISANDPNFEVEFGKSFYLEVSTFDGRMFQSEPETLYPLPSESQVSYQITDQEIINGLGELDLRKVVEFQYNTDIQAVREFPKSRIRLNPFRVFRLRDDTQTICYVTDRLSVLNPITINGDEFTGNQFEKIIYAQTIDHHFAFDYVFAVESESLSEGAITYFEQIGDLSNPSGDLFQKPPGKVKTNIVNMTNPSERPYGYFYVTELDTSFIFIDSIDVGEPAEFCPTPPGPGIDICDTCEFFPNATILRPYYYPQ